MFSCELKDVDVGLDKHMIHYLSLPPLERSEGSTVQQWAQCLFVATSILAHHSEVFKMK